MIYLVIVDEMKKVKFVGVSSTSYRVQKQCVDSIKGLLSSLDLNKYSKLEEKGSLNYIEY